MSFPQKSTEMKKKFDLRACTLKTFRSHRSRYFSMQYRSWSSEMACSKKSSIGSGYQNLCHSVGHASGIRFHLVFGLNYFPEMILLRWVASICGWRALWRNICCPLIPVVESRYVAWQTVLFAFSSFVLVNHCKSQWIRTGFWNR